MEAVWLTFKRERITERSERKNPGVECTFVSTSRLERGTAAKEKRLAQTRLKSKGIPHGDSACGKVWCN